MSEFDGSRMMGEGIVPGSPVLAAVVDVFAVGVLLLPLPPSLRFVTSTGVGGATDGGVGVGSFVTAEMAALPAGVM